MKLSLAIAALVAVAEAAHVHPELISVLETGGTSDILVQLNKAPNAREWADSRRFASRGERGTALKGYLESLTSESQRPVLDMIESMSSEMESVKSYWISNCILVKGASKKMVKSLANMDAVMEITPDLEYFIDPVIEEVPSYDDFDTARLEYGITLTQTDTAWEEFGRGAGVRIATIDTGARGTHEALRGNFAGDVDGYGWFDPAFGTAIPDDRNNHGSHCTGTVAGAYGIGVAPDAIWMACRGCATSSCSTSDLLACGEWVACPTHPDGSNADCSKAPVVVSNSWGGGQGSTTYAQVTEAYLAAGIIPVFSQGNSGNRCGTANSPGDYRTVIGVAASDSNDVLASFSSRGPPVNGSFTGDLKPEISGPGVSVRSATMASDTSYSNFSGTSMSCPHVAGLVALIQAQGEPLSFEEIKEVLFQSADREGLASTNQNCGGGDSRAFPNYEWGHGRMNSLAALNMAKQLRASKGQN